MGNKNSKQKEEPKKSDEELMRERWLKLAENTKKDVPEKNEKEIIKENMVIPEQDVENSNTQTIPIENDNIANQKIEISKDEPKEPLKEDPNIIKISPEAIEKNIDI